MPRMRPPHASITQLTDWDPHSAGAGEVRVVPDPSAWHACLSSFSVRNLGRPVRLEMGDAAGVRGRVDHRRLIGVALVLGDAMLRATLAAPDGDEPWVEYSVPDVSRLVVDGLEGDGDLSMRIEHRGGWAALTFSDDGRAAGRAGAP